MFNVELKILTTINLLQYIH
uniref:Uncharacterized protein n=1 Tax=Rhizophora mucronata TaxID=61149 RepID=A0A2P2QGK7_RHIMU